MNVDVRVLTMDTDDQIILADPPGSGLYNLITNGVLFSPFEREGKFHPLFPFPSSPLPTPFPLTSPFTPPPNSKPN